MTGSGGAPQGRRLLVATAVAHYRKAPVWDRPALVTARQQMIDLFTGTLGYTHLADLGMDPTQAQLTEQLRTVCMNRVRPEDYLIVYIAGHGEVLDEGGGRHVLLTADTDPDDIPGALPTLQLADKMLLGTPVQRLLLLLDTCYSGSGGSQIAAAVLVGMNKEWTTNGAGLVVVTSTQPFEQAETGAFPTLLTATVQASSTAGQVPTALDLAGVVQAMNNHPNRPAHQQIGMTALGLTGTFPDFLPNPRHRPGVLDIDLRLQQAAEWDTHAQRRETEFQSRFLLRASGGHGPGQPWWFTGRHAALTDITTWLTHPRPSQPPTRASSPGVFPETPALVVTAGPGSGKTAVLGLVSALTHPEHHRTVPIDAIQLAPEAIPPTGAVDVSIYAGGLTHEQVHAGLAAAAHVGVGTIGQLITALDAHAAATCRPFTAIIDALDEAADPTQLIARILRPIIDHARHVRLLLGARPHLLQLLRSADTPTHARVSVIDLDDHRWADRRALIVYTIRNLLEAPTSSPYRNAPLPHVRAVADAVAAAADPSFLVAGITATTLAAAQAIADPTDPQWRAGLPRLPGDAMRTDLDTRLGSDAHRVRDLLRPLAYAEGSGLPWEDIWASLASRICGRTYTDIDLHWLRAEGGSYVVETSEAGRSAYRLYHQALAEHLRADTTTTGVTDATIQQAFVDILSARVPCTLDVTKDWAHAHPYTLRHLASHAAAAGILDTLVDEADYLVHADPDTLLPAFDLVRTNEGHLARTVYRASVTFHQHTTPETRRQLLAIDAARAGAENLQHALSKPLTWQPRWATGRLINPALHMSLTGHTQPGKAVACSHLPDGTPIAVTVARDVLGRGEVIAWNLATGRRHVNLAGHRYGVQAVACTRLSDGTPIAIITGGKYGEGIFETGRCGEVIIYNLTTGQQHATLNGHTCPVIAVACTRLPDGTPIAITSAARRRDKVIVWNLTTGRQHATLSGHPGEVNAVACTRLSDGTPIAIAAVSDTFARVKVIVWNLATGRQHATLTGHTWIVNTIACTHLPDGTPIAVTVAGDSLRRGEVIVWNLATGRRLYALAGHTHFVQAVACTYLPDGTPIVITAVGGGHREVIVWNLATGRRLYALAGHTHIVQAIACTYLPDGTPIAIAAVGGGRDRVIVYNLATGMQLIRLAGHTESVNAVACTHRTDGTSIAVTAAGDAHDHGARGEVIVWDLATGRRHATLTGHTRPVKAVACTHLTDGTPVAITAGYDYYGFNHFVARREVIVWDLATGRRHATLTGHTRPVKAVACTHLTDGTPVAVTVGYDYTYLIRIVARGEVIVWNLATGRRHATLAHNIQYVDAVACTDLPDGTPIAVTAVNDDRGEVIVWDLATGRRHFTLTGHTHYVRAVACSYLPDGTPIAVTAAGDSFSRGEVIVWDLAAGRQRMSLTGRAESVNAVACTYLPDGTPIAVTAAGNADNRDGRGEVIVWDLTTGRQCTVLATPYPVTALTCDSNQGLVLGSAKEVIVLEYAFRESQFEQS